MASLAATDYGKHLRPTPTFTTLLLEDVLAAIVTYAEGEWVTRLWERYGDSGRLKTGWPPIG